MNPHAGNKLRSEQLLLFAPLVLVLIPFLIAPLVLGAVTSLTNYSPAELHLRFVGLANYAAVLADRDFVASWRNILIFVLIAVPLELILGLGLAYLLREPFRGRTLVRIALLMPWLVSPIANGVMWHFLLDPQVGPENFVAAWLHLPEFASPLANSFWTLPTVIATDVWRNAPLACFLLLPGMLALSVDQWEYGTLEGATLLVRLRDIIVPSLRPLLLAVALLLIGSTLGTFDEIIILTGGGPGSATVTPALYGYLQVFHANYWQTGAAAAWLIVLGMCMIGLIYLRAVRPEAA